MRKAALIVCLVFFCAPLSIAQDYEGVDATIELYPKRFKSAEELSSFISRDFQMEEEKVRAIYTWIIQNVAYEPDEYKKFNFNFKNYRERNQKEEKTRKKVIARTLQEGIAVCEGYAMLFERLCELQGISNYLVRGDIKTHFNDIGRPFRKTHMWNVAYIDGKPYLFDPTWGAGKYREKFIKEPSYFYYKTPPELFINTHYPHQGEDTFIDPGFSKQDFANMPFIISHDVTLQQLNRQKEGVISSQVDDGTIPFSIQVNDVERVSYSYTLGKEVKEAEISKGDTLDFSIPIELGSENLLIYFNDKPALGYKIK
ncbi:transglutaminase domain-containing protein [Aureisphaera galaxeae]|uniref:transglutaminase domain-containing protein n=1 Tax=Aureisphaera galaxeae TaxID=1538023 RepID=UPI00235009C8|nr:transglutaminase domain-containing protein [Aureisphaera galaxeae]MDC8002878.1 transglutaminase domain-containing protein [Aureisphaera galaxeae]